MFKTLIVGIFTLWIAMSLSACTPDMTGFAITDGYVAYMPETLDRSKKYPMLYLLTPDESSERLARMLKPVADEEGFVLVVDKHYRKDKAISELYSKMEIALNECMRDYPVNTDHIIAGGFDEGASAAYSFVEAYPKLLKGVIANCGILAYGSDQYRNEPMPSKFPREKFCAFITSKDDYRFNQMDGDRTNLEAWDWKVKWIETEDGHALANAGYWSQAMKWLKEQLGYGNSGEASNESSNALESEAKSDE